MATGGDVPGKIGHLDKDSDGLLNFLCSVCKTENKKTEAVKYCVTCEDYYCTECVKFHYKVPAMSRHVIVGKSDFKGTVGGNKLPSIPTERCALHQAKIVDMFCETHDRVGCATCMATTHGESCTKLYIPDNINILFDTEKIKHSEQQLRSAIKNIEDALGLREQCLANMIKVVDAAREQLENYTDHLLKTVTELKKKTEDRLDSIRSELESVLSEQSSALQKEMEAAKDVLQKTTDAILESNNKSQQITCSNLAAMTAQKCKDAHTHLVCPDVREISFRPHATCKQLFNILLVNNSLGEFSLLPLRKQSVCVPYKIVKNEKRSVRVKSDKEDCYISGSCTLQNGTVLLADKNNACLKRLSLRASSVSDCLQLPGSPRSVSVINQKEVAVTLPGLKKVTFIALDATMMTTKALKLDFECYSITHCNNELFISDSGNTVYVYTVAGKLLRQFSQDNTGKTLFSDIRNMAVSESGRMLFVADWEKGLITIEKGSGRQLWCYSGDDLKNATGVCVDGRGGLFVSGRGSFNVIQFSESGGKTGEIVTQADGIVKPRSVCFVTVTSTLVATQDNNIMHYQLSTK